MIAVAGARDINPQRAAQIAAKGINEKGGKEADCCLVFFKHSNFSYSSLNIIRNTINAKFVLGSSFAFLLSNNKLFDNDIVLIAFKGLKITPFFLENIKSQDAAFQLESLAYNVVRQPQDKKDNFSLFLFDADINYPPTFAQALQRAGLSQRMFLALATGSSNRCRLKPAIFVYNKRILNEALVGVLAEEIAVSASFSFSFKPLGRKAKITSYDKNIVYKIENQPASSWYKRYFGPKYQLLNQGPLNMISLLYPLGFYQDQGSFIYGSPARVHLNGALEFWGNIPSDKCQFTISTRRSIIKTTAMAFERALKKISSPQLILIVEPWGRIKAMGNAYYRIFDMAKELVGSVPIVSISSLYILGDTEEVSGIPKIDVLDHVANIIMLGEYN